MPEGGGMCGLIQGCHHYECRYSPPYINFTLLQFHVYCCIFMCTTSNGEIVCLKQKQKIVCLKLKQKIMCLKQKQKMGIYKQL